ncbi:MAG: hypothetical protein IKQ20_06305 [Bacteroidales bacterium]|nr:hypothetical protein [Bacteroidales bacterium]
MKNWRLKFLVVSVACVLAVVAVKYLPALLCGGGESEVYPRYEHRDDLKVGFVKDYRIDDSTTVDVTTLTAKDSAGWEALLREMNKPESLIELMRKYEIEGRYNVTGYYCEVEHPELTTPYKEGNSWYVILNPTERTIYIYQLSNCKARSIIKNKLKEVKDKAKNY